MEALLGTQPDGVNTIFPSDIHIHKLHLTRDHTISWFCLNRSRDRQLLRTVCEAEVVCESVFGLMDLNGDGQLDADQLRGAIAEKRFESGAKTAFVARHGCFSLPIEHTVEVDFDMTLRIHVKGVQKCRH